MIFQERPDGFGEMLEQERIDGDAPLAANPANAQRFGFIENVPGRGRRRLRRAIQRRSLFQRSPFHPVPRLQVFGQ